VGLFYIKYFNIKLYYYSQPNQQLTKKNTRLKNPNTFDPNELNFLDLRCIHNSIVYKRMKIPKHPCPKQLVIFTYRVFWLFYYLLKY
jgi:hypothetical protein